MTWSISSNAENGTASIDAQSGALSYQPDPNWYGTDSFSVSVTDGIISSSIDISVTVSSVDDLPVLDSPLSDQSMNEDQSNLSLDLSGVFNDVDTIDSFTYSVTSTILWLQSPYQVLTLSCPCSPINSATQRFPCKQPREIKLFPTPSAWWFRQSMMHQH